MEGRETNRDKDIKKRVIKREWQKGERERKRVRKIDRDRKCVKKRVREKNKQRERESERVKESQWERTFTIYFSFFLKKRER